MLRPAIKATVLIPTPRVAVRRRRRPGMPAVAVAWRRQRATRGRVGVAVDAAAAAAAAATVAGVVVVVVRRGRRRAVLQRRSMRRIVRRRVVRRRVVLRRVLLRVVGRMCVRGRAVAWGQRVRDGACGGGGEVLGLGVRRGAGGGLRRGAAPRRR